ncbi:MAG: PLP-dependent aminotransferase family protein [Bauldia sp.]|uniref:MocR-like pyridoxine biosynthesis transcription factor PdxR n=1 Tax=Bauldia sp. TaxID=2575872 RepID=UPI001DA88707|nr:PLP-dependent aminotransferase family protein [Bauldia sp.]MCB1496996.1 PLP-dependent aminotransferase family protein [Bauldia sp.]
MTGRNDDLAWLFDPPPAGGGLERQIYRRIRSAVLERRLRPGTRLPASRRLAVDLGVSRGTVVAAYDQLIAEGYLEACTGRGTAVTALPDAMLGAPDAATAESTTAPASSTRAASFRMPAIGGGLDASCFPPGVPSLDTFPKREWSRCLAARARRLRAADMTYDNAAGLPILRETLIGHLNPARGVVAEPDQVIIVPSAQAAFDAAAICTTEPGDLIAVEDPGYPHAREVLAAAGGVLAPVPVDADGIEVAALTRLKRFRLVAVTPSHQYPTGVTMSLERRLRLLDLARERGAFILEDDYDSEFRYAERPIASLQGIDGGRTVIYVGTFSKSLAPGIRVAYLIAPPSLATTLARIVVGKGQVVAGVVQAALADFIAEGYLAAHIGRMRAIYAAKRDALVEALRANLPSEIRVEPPRGGLQLLLRLPDRTDDKAIVHELAAAGIEARALSRQSLRATGRGLLLGYAIAPLDAIAPAAKQLAAIVSRHLDG